YIRYDPETWGGRHPQAFLDDRGLQVHAIGDLDALEAIAMLVADEVGISLVPHWPGLEKLAPTCTLLLVAPEQYQREIILLGPRQATRPAMIQALLQALHS
ncbi:MAG: LysR family transcriptional regulator, partial [Burkholderiales bacterium]|nr:LysR family transcriptional regulator [Burkholderiales bacterium]